MNIYAPQYFRVKNHPNITNGFKHLYQNVMDAKSYFQNDNIGWEIFIDRILNNSYFLNQEHFILALLSDERKPKRKLGKKLAMEARKQTINGVRTVIKIEDHQLNYKAKDYSTFLKGLYQV